MHAPMLPAGNLAVATHASQVKLLRVLQDASQAHDRCHIVHLVKCSSMQLQTDISTLPCTKEGHFCHACK